MAYRGQSIGEENLEETLANEMITAVEMDNMLTVGRGVINDKLAMGVNNKGLDIREYDKVLVERDYGKDVLDYGVAVSESNKILTNQAPIPSPKK